MEKSKETMLTDYMGGFQVEAVNYNDYEISFRRWLISQIDSESMSIQEARDRFNLNSPEYRKIIKRWQERYSVSLTNIRVRKTLSTPSEQ